MNDRRGLPRGRYSPIPTPEFGGSSKAADDRGKNGIPPGVRRARAEEAERAGLERVRLERVRMQREEAERRARQRIARAAEIVRPGGGHLATERELRNIKPGTSGYQVVVTRNRQSTSRWFSGFTEESLQAAMEYRDELLRGRVRFGKANPIPQEVLDALGLKEPVLGISDCPYKRAFRVSLASVGRKEKPFYYRKRSKVEAYAAAVAFREELLAQRHAARR